MIEIKFLGKGGQGVVVASEILARSCFEEGLYPQCYSMFGGERRGATVAAFVRVSHEKIYLKCDIDHPNHIIVFDPSLFNEKEIMDQIVPGGSLLLNMEDRFPIDAFKSYQVGWINAFEISKRNGLGGVVNTGILGAYVRLCQIVKVQTLLNVIREIVPTAIDQNIAAALEAYETVTLM